MLVKFVVITLMDRSIWVDSGTSMCVDELLKLLGMDVSWMDSLALKMIDNLWMKVINWVALLLGLCLDIDSVCSCYQK